MANTTFSGPVRSLNGFISFGPKSVVSLTADATLTVAEHAGRLLLCNKADGEFTLPTIKANSASAVAGANDFNVDSNLGCTYTFLVQTAFTAGKIQTDGTDVFIGYAKSLVTTAATGVAWFPGGSDTVMSFDGSTTGGIVGTYVQVTATADDEYFVDAIIKSSGSQATPFGT